MTKKYVDACTGEKLAARSIAMLKQLDTPDTMLGARVSLYEHSLQTATRAYRAGEDEETVVISLLHDVGELMSPSAHGDVVAGILKPYISQKVSLSFRCMRYSRDFIIFILLVVINIKGMNGRRILTITRLADSAICTIKRVLMRPTPPCPSSFPSRWSSVYFPRSHIGTTRIIRKPLR